MRFLRLLIVVVLVLLATGGAGFWYLHAAGKSGTSYRTESVTSGDMLASFNATGTVEPEDVVDVGAQVAGRITSFGQDRSGKTVDFGSEVGPDTVLARIDDSIYQAVVEQSRADVKYAQADLAQAKAQFAQAERGMNRANQLIRNQTMAQEEYDGFLGTYQQTQALIAVKEGALAKAQAALKQNQTNLDYCTIKAGISGTVIDRRVTVGQTVQSSFNTPSLFLLAKDLKRMKVWASVNEADVGNVKLGQKVTFTVDGRPNHPFVGTVGLIRLNAAMTNNVVTYTIEVVVDNSDGALLPYMTAQLKFEVEKHPQALLVSNAALRWSPTSPQQVAPEAREAFIASKRKAEAGDPATDKGAVNRGTVWVQDGGFVRPVELTLGLTDGVHTEVLSGGLKEGATLVTGEAARQTTGAVTNPFTPQMNGKKQQ